MKHAISSLLLLALILMPLTVLFTACQNDTVDRLPDVVIQGVPEEPVMSTIKTGGFTIDIHRTYAEIKEYSGSDTVLTLPASAAGLTVKLIGEGAFRNNTKITRVILPSSTLTIGRYAFEGCTALTEVVFNEGLETISDYAFRNSGLTILNLPDSVASIGKYCFYSIQIESLVLPDGVSRLSKYAFYGCSRLTSITFQPRLYEIGERAFYNCTALTEIIIPKTITKIDPYAFSSCIALTKIVIPSETTSIGEGVFTGCAALTIYAPAGSEAERIATRNAYRFEVCDYDSLVTAGGDA